MLELLGLWIQNACASAIDSTVLIARGSVWHKKDCEKGEVTPANVADNEQALVLIETLHPGLHFLLGDQHYHDEALRHQCQDRGCTLVTSFTGKNNSYPHHDDGVKVCQILHKTRSIAIENFNEHFKAIFDVRGAVPTKGLLAIQRFVLSAVFVYQLAILYSFLHNLDLRVGLKALLKAA